jgi:hypothetical protein
MKIYVTIKYTGHVELITDAHRSLFPKESHSNDFAYDYCVCPKNTHDRLPCVIAGRCEWQGCGYEEYSDDLPINLIAGRIAYEIRLDYRSFMAGSRQWLKNLASKQT